MKSIEIFRAGTHIASSGRKVTITTADLAACAAAYDTALQEAPIVVGHPKTNAPAYGWISGLELRGDVLVGTPSQVNADFAQMVQDGAFKKRSASFYGPDEAGNPVPGKFYLRHAGFLGAVAPAVAGLKEIEFAAGSELFEFADWQALRVVSVLGRFRDFLIAQFGPEKADAVISADDIQQMTIDAAQLEPEPCPAPGPSFSQGATMTEAEIQALIAENAKLKGGAVEFAQQQKATRTVLFTGFVDGLITAGKLPTGHKDPLIAFMAALPHGDDATFEFAQADGKKAKVDPAEWFQGFLKELPQLVPLGEAARHRKGEDFAQHQDGGLDPSAIYDIHNRAQK